MLGVFFFQAEDGIRDLVRSRGLGDVYKRQHDACHDGADADHPQKGIDAAEDAPEGGRVLHVIVHVHRTVVRGVEVVPCGEPVSYTHLRAHETVLDIVCRLLLEKKKTQYKKKNITMNKKTNTRGKTQQH